MRRGLLLCVVAVIALAGCRRIEERYDVDGDGVEDAIDCAPEDPEVYQGAPDSALDDIDQNCDGVSGIDTDGDGYASTGSDGDDCNDSDAGIHPDATEIPNNEFDEDCDGIPVFCDDDGDGLLDPHPVCGGDDCDDTDYSCLYAPDCADEDGDGVWPCKGDCDDTNPQIPAAVELCNGIDDDCADGVPEDELDADGDGMWPCQGDCDDGDATTWGHAPELCDGLDNGCNGLIPPSETDGDGDGYLGCAECDDDDPGSFPGAEEVPYDGIDQDCDGADLTDIDGDGWDGNLAEDDPDLDCNDLEPTVHPGALDPLDDGLDTNCDDLNGVDADGDGAVAFDDDCDDSDPEMHPWDEDGDGFSPCDGDCDDTDISLNPDDADQDGFTSCDGDCDDTNAAMFPGNPEVCDLFDNDCDGVQFDEADEDGDGDPICSDCDEYDPLLDSLDRDGDGWDRCPDELSDLLDCDDLDPDRNPGEPDIPEDGVDSNCDGVSGVDADGDTYPAWVEDCDDSDADLNLDDADGDGTDTCEGDCDDDNAAVEPGNPEVIDGIDNDCDGLADQGTWAFDDDGDGSCEGWDFDLDGTPECTDGTVPGDCDDADPTENPLDLDGDGYDSCDGQDCDDSEPLTYPGAAEQCDWADNDCDWTVDEGVNDIDADGDGFFPCQGDCDDLDELRFPMAVEQCNGIDDDCDGVFLADELTGDPDGDGSLPCAGDCDDDDPSIGPRAAELCDGIDRDCDGLVDDDCLLCDRTVPTDHATIQEAIDASVDGETVCVEPGTYVELIDYLGVDIALVGLQGDGLTTIDGDGSGPVVTMWNVGAGGLLQGFTITGGVGAVGGVHASNTDGELRLLTITGNQTTIDESAAGLRMGSGTSLLADSTVSNNLGPTWDYSEGGGVGIYGSGTKQLLRVVIEDNVGNFGGGLNCESSAVEISGAIFRRNDSPLGSYLCDLTVLDTVFADNTGDLAVYYGLVQMRRVRMEGNSGSRYIRSSPPSDLSHLVVVGNTGDFGGGLHLEGSLPLRHSVIAGNHAWTGGGGIWGYDWWGDAVDVVVYGNTAGGYGGVRLGAGRTDWSYSDVFGNSPVDFYGDDPTGGDGMISVDPDLTDTSSLDARWWDVHLSATSPLIDAGDPTLLDPDTTTSDIGVYGGGDADLWDLDGDGFPLWWHPGPYDPTVDPNLGWDCDDRDPLVYPGQGC